MIRVEVVFSPAAGQVDRVELDLPDGALLSQALEATGWAHQHAWKLTELSTGIWGRKHALNTPLRDRDRVEIYRGLQCDPKEARRQRFRKRGKATSL